MTPLKEFETMSKRIKHLTNTLIVLLLTLVTTNLAAVSDASFRNADGDAWRFRVYLDDKEIGYHHFYLGGEGDTRQLHTKANFEYRLLFVKLYEYEHENREIWSDGCLQSIESRTDANGRVYAVDGRRESGGFRVDGDGGEVRLPECVMTFAYWNPAFLQQERLLNSQDGQFLDIEVSPPTSETLEVRGQQRAAYRYRLVAGDLKLDLWYSPEREWLALESEVSGGRTLRYELM
jgi:hypothetical protein